jgi:hypothetical protein
MLKDEIKKNNKKRKRKNLESTCQTRGLDHETEIIS